MRHLTQEEIELNSKMMNEELSEEEKDIIRKRLIEIDEEETGGNTWLT